VIMPGTETVIRVRNLKKYFELRKGFLSFGKEVPFVKAVDDVNFDIQSGEILGLVGESGCGKTTTGRLLTRLEDPTDGAVFFLGRDIALLEGDDVKVFRRNIQMVFQDPYESLNPRTNVLQSVMEPLVNHNIGETLEERTKMVAQALEDAGLAPAREYLTRFPHELSGGQRQRVSIARALVIKPKVIVADEPVSMLDVSIRAGVLNLMLDLREKYGIPYLFITHDIAVARYLSDRLGVMYLGRVVELGETDKVVFEPKHPYTRALLSAVPVPDPETKHGRIKIKGEIPSAANVPLGCRFRPRCPQAFKDCGWQGEDLKEWIEENGMLGPGAPLGDDIAALKPDRFVLEMMPEEGASPDAILENVRAVLTDHKNEPMFQAVGAADRVIADRVLEISCKAARLSAEELASELFAQLEAVIRYKETDHPMHGVITDMRQSDNTITVSLGSGAKGNLEAVEALLEDYVRHYRRRTRPEFKGVRRISSDESKGAVVITCASSKEPAAKVARDIADAVRKTYAASDSKGLGGLLMPVKVSGRKVRVRVIGPEDNWSQLAKDLEAFLKSMAEGGLRCARAVSGIDTKTVKGPKDSVAVKFNIMDEPPLYDAGGGHQVACYLFRPGP
jgi:peptide/nickel transport system ATP-binding protein